MAYILAYDVGTTGVKTCLFRVEKDIELLVNACCQPECQGRLQHYKDISQQQIAFCNHIKK